MIYQFAIDRLLFSNLGAETRRQRPHANDVDPRRNDNDVPIAEDAQYYIAPRHVGRDAVMVWYPRQGHACANPCTSFESTDFSIRWYEKYFR
jgi:hypothetical protein